MPTMRTIALILACVIHASQGRRFQNAAGRTKGSANKDWSESQSFAEMEHEQSHEVFETPNSVKVLALALVALNPAAGFQLGGVARSHSALGTNTRPQMGWSRNSAVSGRRGDVSMGLGYPYFTDSAPQSSTGPKAQDFLEFSPYYDNSKMPNNVFSAKNPFEGKIKEVRKIVGPDAPGETYDIVIQHGGDMPYIEGQSYGVIPPGDDPKRPGKPNRVRLYSIASSRYGDDMSGTTATLCVRRATYWCPELGAEDPAKKGVCSNYLCDAKAGDLVTLTGPSGKVMLLPEDKPEADIIMVATGTGIAPYRGFLRRMFIEDTPYAKDFKGLAWLFLGVNNEDSLLYDDDWKAMVEKYPDNFRYDTALSMKEKNKDGGAMYIQNKMEEYSDEIFDRLDKGAHLYVCGLKGMLTGIQDMLKKAAEAKNLDYDEFLGKLKKNGQWHVEVY